MASRETRYLKFDPSRPSPYTTVSVSDIKDATVFRTEREAQTVKRQVKDALAVTKEMDGVLLCCRPVGVHNKTVNPTYQWHACYMVRTHEIPTKEIAGLTTEMGRPRIAASVALTVYECSR
jgi:hypothetical protein